MKGLLFRIAGVLGLIAMLVNASWAQASDASDRQLPLLGDVTSVESVVGAIYDVISGPHTAERDWDRFRSLFAPDARLIPARHAEDGSVRAAAMSPEEYIERASKAFRRPGGFFENEIGRKTEVYGSIAHVFSAYESLREGEDEPFTRGINSFQLVNDGEKWLIVSIFWEAERPDNIIPDKYLFE